MRADPTIPLVQVGVRSNQTPSQVFTNASGIELCRVPAGEFMMGSPKDEPGRDDATESPYHKVRITKPFWIQAREVTQGEWTRVMGSTLKDLSDMNWREWKRGPDSPPRGPDLPMYWVSWFDAIAFCNKLSEKDDRKPYYKLTNIAYEPYGNGALDKADLEILGGPVAHHGWHLMQRNPYAHVQLRALLAPTEPGRDRVVCKQYGHEPGHPARRFQETQCMGHLRHARQHDGMVC
ncbi:MAG: formylglycine-generating enzyme family protein [Verrucomicrobia bacterium]|nr:formylglycine-generating enzyme family protein [Verrucomicrobiota bacterium]